MTATISNQAKQQLWQAYANSVPTRVPVRLNTNPRIVLMDEQLNPKGYTIEQAQNDPAVNVEVALQWQLHLRTVLNQFTDGPTGLPDVWEIRLWVYNVYEAAILGAPVHYPAGQLPCTEPILDEGNKYSIFERDIENPLESDFCRKYLQFWRDMERICSSLRFEGRPVRLVPWSLTWTDGPVTGACNLRGTDFLLDLMDDDGYAQKLMDFLVTAAIQRRRAFEDYWGERVSRGNGVADDSCAMLSPDIYEQKVLPHHRRFYDAAEASLPRMIHLCGDASRLFPMIRQQLNVTSFDTGFPINHGAIRRQLGTDVEIAGGPEVALLLQGTADAVYERTRRILLSGVKEGGRFILQEANNLPPKCPLPNLRAMYEACLAYGPYDA